MVNDVDNAPFVDIWRGMGFVTANQRLLPRVIELSPRARRLEHLVAEVLKHSLEFSPFEIRGWRVRAQPSKSLLMLRHGS